MQFSSLKSALAVLLLASPALAHHLVAEIHIDGAAQGPGKCVRLPPNTNFMLDAKAPDMACGIDGSRPVDITCAANGSSPLPPSAARPH